MNRIVMKKGNDEELLGTFSLTTLSDCFFGCGKLESKSKVAIKDTVELLLNDKTFANVFIDDVVFFSGLYIAYLKEGTPEFHYKKILDSYRKEKAKNIVDEILQSAKISDYTFDVTDEEIERFHISNDSPATAVRNLISALSSYTGEEIVAFFDRNGKFNIIEKSKLKQSEVKKFQSGKSVFSLFPGLAEVPVCDVRTNENMKIDDVEYIVTLSHVSFVNGKGVTRLRYE